MLTRRCLAAYTAPQMTPAYLSIYAEEDGTVSLTVRSTGDRQATGAIGSIRISPELAAAVFADAQASLARVLEMRPKR